MPPHYAILHFCPYLQLDGFILEFWTNTPCHLTLRYTETIPVKHQEPTLRRGLLMHEKTRYCFVAYKELDQHEAGDTLHHSFNLILKKKIRDVWFHTIGTIGGVDSPSTSPIMHLPFDMENQNLTRWAYKTPNFWAAVRYDTPRATRFRVHYPMHLTGIRLFVMGWPNHLKIRVGIYKWSIFNFPVGPALTYCQLAHVPYKRSWTENGYLFFPIPPIWTEAYQTYAIIAWGDPLDPSANVMTWQRYLLPPFLPNEVSFYGVRDGDTWTWHADTIYAFQYELYVGTGYVKPCETVPANIIF